MSVYGYDNGGKILVPKGWRILDEGETVPHQHREFIVGNGRDGSWAAPRRCRSTMTPLTASVWGSVRAYAVPEEVRDAV
jgi:hypothetical protein